MTKEIVENGLAQDKKAEKEKRLPTSNENT